MRFAFRHLISEKLKFDYLKNEKGFGSEIKKSFFLVTQVLSFTGWPLIPEISEKPPKLKSYPRKCSRKFLNSQNPRKFSKNTPENPRKFLLCDFFFNF